MEFALYFKRLNRLTRRSGYPARWPETGGSGETAGRVIAVSGDQGRALPIVYSPIMTGKHRESTGCIRLVVERKLLPCNALPGTAGIIRIGRPLIRWLRVRARHEMRTSAKERVPAGV
jgi:hypothetical protein